MKLDKIVQTLPLALLVKAGQLAPVVNVESRNQSTDLHAAASKLSDAKGNEAEVLLDAPETLVREERQMMRFTGDIVSWDNEYAIRYHKLVEKEALSTISREELSELERLQKLRRRFESPPTSEEIITRHLREKMDRELTAVLKRYVSIAKFPKNRS